MNTIAQEVFFKKSPTQNPNQYKEDNQGMVEELARDELGNKLD